MSFWGHWKTWRSAFDSKWNRIQVAQVYSWYLLKHEVIVSQQFNIKNRARAWILCKKSSPLFHCEWLALDLKTHIRIPIHLRNFCFCAWIECNDSWLFTVSSTVRFIKSANEIWASICQLCFLSSTKDDPCDCGLNKLIFVHLNYMINPLENLVFIKYKNFIVSFSLWGGVEHPKILDTACSW